MKTRLSLVVVTIVLWLVVPFQALADASSDPYRLQQGDTVQISVWGDSTLQKDLKVLPDGSVTFPLVGRVEVGGLSTTEAEKRITEKLKAFLPEPQVTVVVTGIDGNRAYILGKVLKPGPIPVAGPLTVLQAFSIVGGVDKFADQASIRILRMSPKGQEVLSLNLERLIKGEELEKNYFLKAGDTILVP